MKIAKFFILTSIMISFFACSQKEKETLETFQWRGPDRDGVFPETELMNEWPEKGPELLWRYDSLGRAYSSAVVSQNFVYTLGTIDSTNILYAFNHKGNLLWQKKLGTAWVKSYTGARSTPLLYESKLYIFDGLGVMHCLDMQGNYIWKRNLLKEYGAENAIHGVHENLVIDGEKLFCTLGAEKANILALNKDTGETNWMSEGTGEVNAYCSPNIITHNNKKYYVSMTFHSIVSVDAESGEVMWSDTLTEKKFGVHANVPQYKDGKLFMIDGVNYGARMYEIAEDGKSAKMIWKTDSLDVQMGDAVVVGNKIFGSGIPAKKWFCLDWNTGKINYTSNAVSYGTIIAADNKFIIETYRGEVALVKPENNDFKVLGKFAAPGKRSDHFTQPVIKNGVLYIRYDNSICAYNIKE